MINYSVLAMQSLVENCQFVWGDPYEYKDIDWLDERPIPTKEAWEKEVEKLKILIPIQERQSKIKQLLNESDYIELPSFIERKGQEIYNTWIEYRTSLRLAYHNFELPIPEKPE